MGGLSALKRKWYHGTSVADDISSFKPRAGGAVWFTDKPDVAKRYEGAEGSGRTIEASIGGDNVLEIDMLGNEELPGLEGVYGYANNPRDVARLARDEGYDAVLFRNTVEGADNIAVLKPDLINQAGIADPKLLAALGGAGAVAALSSEEAEAAPMGTLADKIRLATRKAFHGSPHDFSPHETNPLGKFDLGKMGTGEGAQAYGHGLYFSSSEDIARFYRDSLSQGSLRFQGADNPIRINSLVDMGVRDDIAQEIISRGVSGSSKADVVHYLNQQKDRHDGFSSNWNAYDDAAKMLNSAGDWELDKGKLYQVEIPDESHMLDWDKPLSEQSEWVKGKLEDAGLYDATAEARFKEITSEMDALAADRLPSNQMREEKKWFGLATERDGLARKFDMNGRELYRRMAPRETLISDNPDRMASEKLRDELGIPGHTYIGGTSDERNYVLYDEDMINIVNKGFVDPKLLTGLGGAAAGYAAFSGREDMPGDEIWSAISDWQNRRASKKDYWDAASYMGKQLMHGMGEMVHQAGGLGRLPSWMGVEDRQGEEAMGRLINEAAPYLESFQETKLAWPMIRGALQADERFREALPTGQVRALYDLGL